MLLSNFSLEFTAMCKAHYRYKKHGRYEDEFALYHAQGTAWIRGALDSLSRHPATPLKAPLQLCRRSSIHPNLSCFLSFDDDLLFVCSPNLTGSVTLAVALIVGCMVTGRPVVIHCLQIGALTAEHQDSYAVCLSIILSEELYDMIHCVEYNMQSISLRAGWGADCSGGTDAAGLAAELSAGGCSHRQDADPGQCLPRD